MSGRIAVHPVCFGMTILFFGGEDKLSPSNGISFHSHFIMTYLFHSMSLSMVVKTIVTVDYFFPYYEYVCVYICIYMSYTPHRLLFYHMCVSNLSYNHIYMYIYIYIYTYHVYVYLCTFTYTCNYIILYIYT